MTGSETNNLVLWAPETIQIMHLTRKLRDKKIPVYFSIDTGPSVVLLTQSQYTQEILTELKNMNKDLDISVGKIWGASVIIDIKNRKAEVLLEDIKKFAQ